MSPLRTPSTSSCTTTSPNRNRITTRSPYWSPIHAQAESWSTPGTFYPDLILSAQQQGAHGYLSKTLPARELVAALEAVHAGDTVISNVPPRARSAVGLDWPGRGEGLSDRESEILALITQGQSNAEVAALTYLSPNTVKSYIRTIYRKIEVSSRTQAVLQSDPGCSMGRETRLHSRPSPHRHIGEVAPERRRDVDPSPHSRFNPAHSIAAETWAPPPEPSPRARAVRSFGCVASIAD